MNPSRPPSVNSEALLGAQLIVESFNLMGCDAVGVGDDEFRLGAKPFTELRKSAKFPFISSNVIFSNGSKILVPYIIKRAGDLKWGIFGLLGSSLFPASQSNAWKVLNPLGKGREVVKELKRKVDLLILLADMPLPELRALVSQLQGITIAVAGHSSSGIRRPLQVGKTIVVRSYGRGRYVGRLDLYLKDLKAPFVDEARIKMVERNLAFVNRKITEKAPGNYEQVKADMQTQLRELKRGNIYRNELVPLSSRFREDQRVKRLVQEYTARKRELEKGCK